MTTPIPAGLFRKKPVVVQATQWFRNGDHPQDYSKTHDGLENGELRQFHPDERRANGWEGDVVRYYRNPDDSSERACQHCGKTMHVHGWIDTKEGGHIVCPGDWIITGVQGEHYPCKPYIFAETYELAAAPSPASVAPGDAQDERQAFDRLPAYITDDRYHLQYRLGWNNCLADCRAAILADAPAAGDALDAKRYRWLRNPQTDVALVLDKRTGYVPPDENIPGVGGYHAYEYRAGEELDAAIDAALAAQVPQQGEA